jgi:hypothetical protein
VPLGAFITLSSEARIRAVAAHRQGEPVTLPAPWHPARFLPVQTMDVGIVEATGEKRVAVIFDRDRPTELSLSFDLSDTRDLAQQLLEEADKAERESRQSRPS